MIGPVKYRSAGIVVARRENGGWKILILRAFRHWDFPKGLIEPGETPLDAARRETAEETGLTDLDFRWGHDSVETEMYGDRKVARFFLAASTHADVDLPVNPELGFPEHEEYCWVTPAEAEQLLPPRLQRVLRWASQRLAVES